jgi:hypothetical protein
MTEKQLYSLDKEKFKKYFIHVFDLVAKRSKNTVLSTDQFNQLLLRYDTLKLFISFDFFNLNYLYELFESIMDDDAGNIDWNKVNFNHIFAHLLKGYVQNLTYQNFDYSSLKWIIRNTDRENILKMTSDLSGTDKEFYVFIIYVLGIISYEEAKNLDRDMFPLTGEVNLEAEDLSRISTASEEMLDGVFENDEVTDYRYFDSVSLGDILGDLNIKNLDLLKKYFIGQEDITEENYKNMEEDTLIDLVIGDGTINDLLREYHQSYAEESAHDDFYSDLKTKVRVNYDNRNFTFIYDLFDSYNQEDLIRESLNCGVHLVCILKESNINIRIRFPDYYDFNLYGDKVVEFNKSLYESLSYIDKPDFVLNRSAENSFNKIIEKLKLRPKSYYTSSGKYKHLENELISIDVYDQENAKNGKLYVHIKDKEHNEEYDGYASPKEIVTYLKNYRLF